MVFGIIMSPQKVFRVDRGVDVYTCSVQNGAGACLWYCTCTKGALLPLAARYTVLVLLGHYTIISATSR